MKMKMIRPGILMAAFSALLALFAGCTSTTVVAQTADAPSMARSRPVRLLGGGGGSGGALRSETCIEVGTDDGHKQCRIVIWAALVDHVETSGFKTSRCLVSTAAAVVLPQAYTQVQWIIASTAKGFVFDGVGVKIDEDINNPRYTVAAPDSSTNTVTATRTLDTSVLKPTPKPGQAGALSYTVRVKHDAVGSPTCDPFDPIVVNQDN